MSVPFMGGKKFDVGIYEEHRNFYALHVVWGKREKKIISMQKEKFLTFSRGCETLALRRYRH